MKKILYMMLVLSLLMGATACEEEVEDNSLKDVTVKEAPSGVDNLDLAGKTFVKEEYEGDYCIRKSTIVYDANHFITSSTNDYIYLVKSKVTVVFSADNTFTVTQEKVLTSAFDAKYSYTYKALPESETYVEYYYSSCFDNFEYNYQLKRPTESASADGESDGDTQTYSGYAGTVLEKEVYIGTWKALNLESDGMEDVTKVYLTTITKNESESVTGKQYESSSSSSGSIIIPDLAATKGTLSVEKTVDMFEADWVTEETMYYNLTKEVDGKKYYYLNVPDTNTYGTFMLK